MKIALLCLFLGACADFNWGAAFLAAGTHEPKHEYKCTRQIDGSTKCVEQ